MSGGQATIYDRLGGSSALLEREDATARIDELLRSVREGQGGFALVEGPAGCGKTSLLTFGRAQAEAQGFLTLHAQGGELERHLAFGLVRQLLAQPLASAPDDVRQKLLSGAAAVGAAVLELRDPITVRAARDPSSVMHGLFWLAVNLAESSPALLIIDDCHWSDEASLLWLSYLAARLDGLRLGLLIAARPDEFRAHTAPGSRLVASDHRRPITLPPLSLSAVGDMLAARLRNAPDERFVTACYALTQGNPFLVAELARAVAQHLLEPTGASIAELGQITPDTVVWTVREQLRRHGPHARAAAEAVAVLGSAVRLSEVAELASMSRHNTAVAVDRLTRSEILRADQGLAFIHPLVQRAVYESIPPATRSEQHRHAARLAAQAGAPPDAIAAHLFKAFPGNDPWAASQLREAATLAAQRAAPEMALTCLRRALDETPPPPLHEEIIADLGLIEARLQDPHAAEHLTIALNATTEPARIADLAGALGRALGLEGRLPEAIDAIEHAIARLPSSYASLRIRLEGDIQAIGRTHPATVARAEARLERLTSDPSVPAVADALPGLLAQRAAWRASARWEETQRLAELALADGRLLRTVGPEAPAYWTKVQALAWCDQYAIAITHADAGLEAAERMGSVVGYVLGCTYRAEIFYRQGRIRACEADAEAALEAIDEHRMTLPAALALAWHVNALIDQQRLAEAWASLASRGLDHGIPTENVYAMALHARALLQMTAGDADAAHRDALAAGELLAPLGRAPTPLPWRATAALAAHTLGDHAEAQRLATTDLDLATRYGAPRAVGIALRTLALVHQPQPDVDLLTQSVNTLEHSQARSELARTLITLGAALRRRRDITASRVPLRRGLDIATECGAIGLAERAREELIASGAKPRKARLNGRDALTPRERRVVELAASGMTNKRIAQQLFLTVRTVETHLYRAYRKLGTSRAGLRNGLPAD